MSDHGLDKETTLSALIYGNLDPGILRENSREALEIFFADCSSLSDARNKLNEQKFQVDKIVDAVVTLDWKNIVTASCSIVEMQKVYAKTLDRVSDARRSVATSKNLLTSLPRNIRQLHFEKLENTYALEIIEKVKHSDELCKAIKNTNIPKTEIESYTLKLSNAYKELEHPKYEKLTLKLELKKNLDKAAEVLIESIDREIHALIFAPTNNYNKFFHEDFSVDKEKEHCREISKMSSFICKILVAKGGKKVDRSTCIESLGKLKTALDAQSKFNALFYRLLCKYNAKPMEDLNRAWENTKTCVAYEVFIKFVQGLMTICEIYMERFWYFYFASTQFFDGDDEYQNPVVVLPPDDNPLLFLWYTVQTDIICILRRHFEEALLVVDKIRGTSNSSNIKPPGTLVARSLENCFMNNEDVEMSFFVHDRLTPWPKDSKTASKVHLQPKKMFEELFVCPPSPYNAVEVFSMVSRTAKKIDAIVQPNNPIKSSTPSRKRRSSRAGSEAYKRPDSAIETLAMFIENARNFLFNCIRTDVIRDVVNICDSPSALERLPVQSTPDSAPLMILSSSIDVIEIFGGWLDRFCNATNKQKMTNMNITGHRNKPDGMEVDESLLQEVVRSIDSGIERYLKWCNRMFINHWKESVSRRKISDFGDSFTLPKSGYVLGAQKFLSWVLGKIDSSRCNDDINAEERDSFESELIQIGAAIDNALRHEMESCSGSTDKIKISTQTLSLIEMQTMEKNYLENKAPNVEGNSTTAEGLMTDGQTQFINEENVIPIIGGLDKLASLFATLTFLESKIEALIKPKIQLRAINDRKSEIFDLFPSAINARLCANECLILLRSSLRIRSYWRLGNFIRDYQRYSTLEEAKLQKDAADPYTALRPNFGKAGSGEKLQNEGLYPSYVGTKDLLPPSFLPCIAALCEDLYNFVDIVLPLLRTGLDEPAEFVLGGLGSLIGTIILELQLRLTYLVCGEDLAGKTPDPNDNASKSGNFKRRRKHDKKKRKMIWNHVKVAMGGIKRAFIKNQTGIDSHYSIIDELKGEIAHSEKILDTVALSLDRIILEKIIATDKNLNQYDKKILAGLIL